MIGYDDCSDNPSADPTAQPVWCNQVHGRAQGQPSLAEVHGDTTATQAALCYRSQADGASSPWFLGLWFWNRDFDAAPYVNPYDLTWGGATRGSDDLETVRAFAAGHDAGACPVVAPSPPAATTTNPSSTTTPTLAPTVSTIASTSTTTSPSGQPETVTTITTETVQTVTHPS